MTEIWNPIPGYEDYEASDQGRVRSLKTGRPYILSQYLRNGYPTVPLCENGKYSGITVHRLVLLAFCGKPGPGQEACHNNGQKSDNRLCNLRYDTHQENMNDTVKHGNHSWSRVAPDEIIVEIRKRYAQTNVTLADLANEYDMDVSAISLIINGKRRVKAGGPIRGIDYEPKKIYTESERRAKRVRELYATSDLTMEQVGKRFGICGPHVSLIVNGKQLKEAGGPIKGVDYFARGRYREQQQ